MPLLGLKVYITMLSWIPILYVKLCQIQETKQWCKAEKGVYSVAILGEKQRGPVTDTTSTIVPSVFRVLI